MCWWAMVALVEVNGVPVLGLASQRGKLLEVTCTRMRWPAWNTLAVDHRSMSYW